MHNVISKFVTMPGECEEYTSSGSVLMAGVKLKQDLLQQDTMTIHAIIRISALEYISWK